MATEFAHLHVHTQYSMLDGAVKVKDLVKKVAAGGMKSVAVTDHGNMFGAISFYKAAKEAGIQAILGCELEVTAPTGGGHSHHLPLLASTLEGYKNLVWLVSRGHVAPDPNGHAGLPCVSLDEIAPRTKGLIAMTGCMGGLVSQSVLEQGPEAGRTMLGKLKEIFEPGSLYVELQDHALVEQPVLNGILLDLATKLELPLCATNDVHYGAKEDAEAHLYLSCIKNGRSYAEAKERHHGSSEMYLKSPAEMARLWKAHPRAIANTLEIAEKCKALKLKLGEPMLPTFTVPDGYDEAGYFRHIAREGLRARFAEFSTTHKKVDEDAYRARLEMELDVICTMKFPGYFLIVMDFINWAKAHGIPVGPGRGSGAGSLVAYSLRITDIDPLPYNLLFERFLNPERVSMPDFDVDFCQDRRGEVIDYVTGKYGRDNVAQIITYGALSAKSAIKDVARVMNVPFAEVNELTRNIPALIDGHPPTIEGALKAEPKLTAIQESKPIFKQIIDYARALEGLTRSTGMHAAGVVIGEKPLWEYVPLCRGQNGELVTQFAKDEVEAAGLVKFDFLGLKTLTVISDAVKLVNRQKPEAEHVDITLLPFDDKKTYELISRGDTAGVFQMESSGFTEMVKKLRPSVFEDIIAAGALYRPGPLDSGMVDVFINRKHGRERVSYPHPKLEVVLKDTYGVIVYQEQVMQIAQILGGYSLGRADILRRAMGKKKAEEMAKERQGFLEGCAKNGVDPKVASDIFDLMEKFAEYGFNKSHSAAYGLVTYQTAWLKAHYPVEFMAALLTSEKDSTDKVVAHIAEARADGIVVLPPDVNDSGLAFGVSPNPDFNPTPKRGQKQQKNLIRFGLGAIKGVGENSIGAILQARDNPGPSSGQTGRPFAGLFDFCSRIDAKKLNRKTVEALCAAGAFDFGKKARKAVWDAIDAALAQGSSAQKDRDSGQFGLFGGPRNKSVAKAGAAEPAVEERVFGKEEWPERERLAKEKEAIGFYITGHPLARYEADCKRWATHTCASLGAAKGYEKVAVAGIVTGWRERITKTGKKIAFAVLEDLTGARDLVIYDDAVQKYESTLKGDDPVLIRGMVRLAEKFGADANAEPTEPSPEIKVDEVSKLSDVRAQKSTKVEFKVPVEAATPERLADLKKLLLKHPGACGAQLTLVIPQTAETRIALKGVKIAPDDELLAAVDRLFGSRVSAVR